VYTKGIIKKEREFKMNIKYKTPGVFKNRYMDRVKFFNKYKKEPFTALEELSDVGVDTLDNLSVNSDMKKLLTKYLVKLNAREERVIRERFFNNKTLEQVGQTYSVTRDRIRQIEAKGLRKLKTFMHKDNEIKELI
jgi:RNA polymerase sigma factor (sigma-70 family)